MNPGHNKFTSSRIHFERNNAPAGLPYSLYYSSLVLGGRVKCSRLGHPCSRPAGPADPLTQHLSPNDAGLGRARNLM